MKQAATSSCSSINQFLLQHNIRIKNNPAISPDLCLDPSALLAVIQEELVTLELIFDNPASTVAEQLKRLTLYPASELKVMDFTCYVVEDNINGDAGFICIGKGNIPFVYGEQLRDAIHFVPLLWTNLITLKNLVQELDHDSTVFPVARGNLQSRSLGIGSRFTTLHWPAVAWAMKTLNLSITANQNSIPRELVYNVDGMLNNRLAEIPFPFIGGNVPEGHQGQSVQGMSHAAIISYLKYGLHKHRIPWGFNADHQPIGGRFDAIEDELVAGCLFASYITFDLSPELAKHRIIEDKSELEEAFLQTADKDLYKIVTGRVRSAGFNLDEHQSKSLFIYLTPAMLKMKRRDQAYSKIRLENFTTDIGRHYFRELSIDELPGETTPEVMALCLAFAEALEVKFDFVAPNIGFQKNFPYMNNAELKAKLERLNRVAKGFDVSIGFHSGSGKSAENYKIIGEITERRLEIKTSGRYTYEMGMALSQSSNPYDQELWNDWYNFTRELVIEGAFSSDPIRQKFARDFIIHTLTRENQTTIDIFRDEPTLRAKLESLQPSPDHMFHFEYNFLFILAAGGSTLRLGDHGPSGYTQRARFYSISEEARLHYSKNVINYIIFLAENTGLSQHGQAQKARTQLGGIKTYNELLEDIAIA